VLARIKWLLFLLILSLLARIVATQAATAEGRIIVTSVANVFIRRPEDDREPLRHGDGRC
jgi:hypothetical protein